MKKSFLIIMVFILSTICWIIFGITAASTSSTIPPALVYANRYRISGNIGDTVTVDIYISNINGLCAGQVGVAYNNTILNCTEMIEGDFLKTSGNETLWITYSNFSLGISIFGDHLLGMSDGVSGTGKFGSFVFKIIGLGSSDIHLRDILLLNYRHIDEYSYLKYRILDACTTKFGSNDYSIAIVGNAHGAEAKHYFKYGYSELKVDAISIGEYKGQFQFDTIATSYHTGNFAFFNVTIPKNLMRCDTPNQWRVFLNDTEQTTRTITQNTTHTTISLEFTYPPNDPVQTFRIQSTQLGPPPPPPQVGGTSTTTNETTATLASYTGLITLIITTITLPKIILKRQKRK